MRNTIKARDGYKVRKVRHLITGEERLMVIDGDTVIMLAKSRSVEEYLSEKDGNECFNKCEVFTTIKGNQFIYWRDEELDEDYITKVEVK